MVTTHKVIEIYCIADDFCKEYEKEIQSHQLQAGSVTKKRNRPTRMSQSEIITVMVCFHCGTFHNFKHYYLFYICKHMSSYFPKALSYNRFVELQPRTIVPLMLLLKLVEFGECTGITFVDSTPIKVCHNKCIYSNKVFKDIAQRGKVQWVGFLDLNSIKFVMKRENYLISH